MNTVEKTDADVALTLMSTVDEKKVRGAAALLIFAVFAMSALTVLMLGVNAYANIINAPRGGYDERIGLSYLWTRIKAGDETGKVYIGEFNGLSALFIEEELAQTTHHTVIYHYNGYIYELFFEAGYEFKPSDGTAVSRSESLLLEQFDNGLIKITIGTESVFIIPRALTR